MFKVSFTADDFKRIGWTALFAFLSVFGAAVSGAGSWHSFSDAKAAVLALIPAAVAALLSAIKNGVLADTSALK